MPDGITLAPAPRNEPARSYSPGSVEKASLKARLSEMIGECPEIPLVIGGREVRTGRTVDVVCPHDHRHRLAVYHQAGPEEMEQAIDAAVSAGREWSALDWESRAAVFLKAADLLSGPWRDTLNAATMLNQSKTVHQAEIDAACELCDFWRHNVHFMRQIYADQPISPAGSWNRVDYRPLEGFVLAITPFNFTAIAGNLPTAPALMGNVVVWKPSPWAVLSGYAVMRLLREAGLPDGVINFVPGPVEEVVGRATADYRLAGVHFTGSAPALRDLWKTVGARIGDYRSYPRLVGESGGKDFLFAHPSADVPAAAAALVRGAFEYQGQKCSAVSRAYLPRSLWSRLREELLGQVAEIRVGSPLDFRNFMAAVIHREAFDRITAAIDRARVSAGAEICFGGERDDRIGFFISPTVVTTEDLHDPLMSEELFGPLLAISLYEDDDLEGALERCEATSPYALTGAVFAQDRAAIERMTRSLRHAAGNFYINDKPTGAVVGQQPFGGARASGTNDKAVSALNLLRWVSPRAIKETFDPPPHFAYPYMAEE